MIIVAFFSFLAVCIIEKAGGWVDPFTTYPFAVALQYGNMEHWDPLSIVEGN